MKKRDLYVILFWIALGLFVSLWAYVKLGIGTLNMPGSGLMPLLLGILFCLLALAALVRVMRRPKSKVTPADGGEDQERLLYKKVILVTAALFAYAILLEPLGFILTTFFTMAVLFRSSGFNRWMTASAYSGIVVFVTYFLFTYLGVRFPPGVLRALGLY